MFPTFINNKVPKYKNEKIFASHSAKVIHLYFNNIKKWHMTVWVFKVTRDSKMERSLLNIADCNSWCWSFDCCVCVEAASSEWEELPRKLCIASKGSPFVSRGVFHPPARVCEIWWPSQPEGWMRKVRKDEDYGWKDGRKDPSSAQARETAGAAMLALCW